MDDRGPSLYPPLSVATYCVKFIPNVSPYKWLAYIVVLRNIDASWLLGGG